MKKKINIYIYIFIGLLLGILGGIFLPDIMNKISFLGTIYINLLKFIIVPILFTTITTTIYKNSKNKIGGKLIFKSIIIFIIMFIVSFLITSLLVYLFNPGKDFIIPNINWDGTPTKFNFSDIIINIFPNNIITMISNNMILSTILFAVVFGIASSKVNGGKIVLEFIEGLGNVFNKILEYIMYISPIGVFALIGSTIANYGEIILGVGLKYILVAYVCSIVVMLLVMILPAWIFAKINPITYIKKVSKVWIMTLTTCSSAATLPYTLKVCNEEFKVPNKITNIVVPLGCTIHMCGGAVSFALLGLFCCEIFNISITLPSFLLMIISSTIINMAAPGIPNGGIVIGATYLTIFNIPLSFIGLYSGIYKLLDMSYTTLNVTGDITANILLNKIEEKKQN